MIHIHASDVEALLARERCQWPECQREGSVLAVGHQTYSMAAHTMRATPVIRRTVLVCAEHADEAARA